jgi:hypothetical protein
VRLDLFAAVVLVSMDAVLGLALGVRGVAG